MANPASPVEAGNAKLGYGIHDNAGADEAALTRIVNAGVVDDEDDPSGALAVASMVLHDDADVAAEGPIKIGGVADSTRPSAVADGDRVAAAFDLQGAMHTVDIPRASGGLSLYSAMSTAAVLSAQVKGSAGQVYSVECFSIDTTPVYVRLYNQTGAPADTDNANIVWRGMVPSNGGVVLTFPLGAAFSTGIGVRATTGIGDTDTGALSASEVLVNVQYA